MVTDPRTSSDWLAGYEAARSQAVAFVRLYENEMREVMRDRISLMPEEVLGDYASDRQGNADISISTGKALAAKDIADALDAMVPDDDRQ